MADNGGDVPGVHSYKNKKKKLAKRAKELEKELSKQSKLDSSTLEYWRRVETTLEANEFEEDEDRSLFISNVLSVLDGNEVKLSKDQDVSRIIEKLLRAANEFQVRVFFDRLSGQYANMACDRYASHVLQAVLDTLPAIIQGELSGHVSESTDAEGADTGELLSAEKLFLEMCAQLRNEWNELARHEYGSHVVRVALSLLCGGGVPETVLRSRSSRSFKQFVKGGQAPPGDTGAAVGDTLTFDVPASFADTLNMIGDTFIISGNLLDDITHPIASAVVQALLLVLHKAKPDACERLVARIISKSRSSDELDTDRVRAQLITDQVGSHVMERVLEVSSTECLSRLYLACFRNQLVELAKDPVANFVVQRLLVHLGDAVQQRMAVGELMEHTESILASGCTGVVARMAQTCTPHEGLQKEFVQQLLKAFHVTEPQMRKTVVPLVLRLTTYDAYNLEGPEHGAALPIVLNGALLLQALWKFKPSVNDVFASSLIGLGTERLVVLCLNMHGSHVIEAFVNGTVDVNKKKKLLKLLKGCFAKLSMDKYGSHTLDVMYAQADLKLKEMVAEELLEREADLRANIYGRKVWRNCQLEHLKRKRGAWMEKQEANERKKAMFAEFLEDEAPKAVVEEKEVEEEVDESAEIDDIFNTRRPRHQRRGEVASEPPAAKAPEKKAKKEKRGGDANEVFAAIQDSKGKKRKDKSKKTLKSGGETKRSKFMMS